MHLSVWIGVWVCVSLYETQEIQYRPISPFFTWFNAELCFKSSRVLDAFQSNHLNYDFSQLKFWLIVIGHDFENQEVLFFPVTN